MSFRKTPTTIALAIAACWTCSSVDAFAQSRLGSSGPLSQPAGGGGSTSGSSSFGRSGAAGQGGSGAQTGLAGFGQNGLSGFGNSGAGNASGASGGFIGRGDNTGRFVGNANAGQQSVTGGGRNASGINPLGGGRGGNFSSNPFSQFGLGNGFNSLGNTPQGKQRKAVKPQQKIAFDYTPLPTPQVAATLTSRYRKLSKREAFGDVEVEVNNGVATLRGSVRKPNDAKLAVILAKLEPGVRSVVNEISVTEPVAPAYDGDNSSTSTDSAASTSTETEPSTNSTPTSP